jgi:hypothetical protein
MTMHALTHGHRPRPAVRRNGLLQLGWAHFWLLIGILGMGLALVVLVLMVQLTPR